MKVIESIRKLVKDESGISAVEYALLLALIGAGIATAATLLGTNVNTSITTAAGNLN
jgi:pilus assembly protein Flp/PilA